MEKSIKRQHSAEFKRNVVLELIRGEQTMSAICSKYSIHPTQARRWKEKAVAALEHSFDSDSVDNRLKEKEKLVEELYNQIGKLKVETDWLKKRLGFLAKSPKDKLSLFDKNLKGKELKYLPIKRQAELLGLSRSTLYYHRLPEVSEEDKLVMDAIDVIFTKCPFYGTRRIKMELKKVGVIICRKKIAKLMRIMGIEAMYPKPNLSLNGKPHPVFPYLLKGLKITRPNQVWGIDITYIRLSTGFVYLTAVIDWYSRLVVAWDLSISLETESVLTCLKKAFEIAVPEILNSDQGVQMTSQEYIDLVQGTGVKISMDHRGRCFDNIFTERLWRTIKYEEVYLKSYESVWEASLSIGAYINFYNFERMHQSLNYQTPAEIHFGKLGQVMPGKKVTKKTQSLAF